MLELDWATLLFQIINFVVLVVGLGYFLFRPLRRKLSERGQVIADTLQRARDQEAEARELREQWEGRMRTVEQETEEILHRAHVAASQRAADLLEETRVRIDHLTDEMRADLYRHRDEVVAQHYDEILDAIIDLSGSTVRSVTTRRTHDDLVTNFCASIYQMPQEEVDEFRRVMAERVPHAFVSTPVALTQDQTKTLADTLSSLIDRHVDLQVNIEPELVAGIQVRLADRLIENSVRHHLNRIRNRVRQDLVSRMGVEAQHG
jgi:F-type H+-transporting ATPase subunit b